MLWRRRPLLLGHVPARGGQCCYPRAAALHRLSPGLCSLRSCGLLASSSVVRTLGVGIAIFHVVTELATIVAGHLRSVATLVLLRSLWLWLHWLLTLFVVNLVF